MKLKAWWLIIFSILSFVIFIRKVDGAETIQTPTTKLAAFIVDSNCCRKPSIKSARLEIEWFA